MGLPSSCLVCKVTRQNIWIDLVVTLFTFRVPYFYSPLHAGSVDLVLNPETGHFSPQFHVVFDYELYTVPFMREGTIPPNCKNIVQRISKIISPYNIDLKDTWFTPDV